MVQNLGEIVHLFRVSDFPCWKLMEAGVVILFISNHCKSYPEVWVLIFTDRYVEASLLTFDQLALWGLFVFMPMLIMGFEQLKYFQYSFTGSTNMTYIMKDKGNMLIVFLFLVFSKLFFSCCADGRGKWRRHSRYCGSYLLLLDLVQEQYFRRSILKYCSCTESKSSHSQYFG